MLTCEKLIHNGRRPRDEVGGFPYKCGQPAARIEVSGMSYKATATLCQLHLRGVEREFGTGSYRFLSKPPWSEQSK